MVFKRSNVKFHYGLKIGLIEVYNIPKNLKLYRAKFRFTNFQRQLMLFFEISKKPIQIHTISNIRRKTFQKMRVSDSNKIMNCERSKTIE